MKTLACLFLVGFIAYAADAPPEMPKPVKEHEWLKQFVGEWESDMEVVMAPGQPPIKGKSSEVARNLGGFWVVSEGKGEMMGMPFEGNSLMGYDLQKKKYFNAWVDSMGTGIMVFEGTCDGAGKAFTFTGEYDDPITKAHTKIRHVTKIVSPEKYTFEWFETGPDGKERKTMSATYTRVK